MKLLLDSAIAGSLVVALTLAAMPLLRHAPAALRHWMLSAGLFCAALAPLVVLVAPAWHLPPALTWVPAAVAPQFNPAGANISVTAATPDVRPRVSESQVPPARGAAAAFFKQTFRWIWTAGVMFGLTAMLVGLARLACLTATARRITHGRWFDGAEQVRREYGLGRPVTLVETAHPSLLVTCGLLRPKLILPACARGWNEDRVRLVLYHELAHVRRGDWIVQLAAELLRSIYWFNPLVWAACARLRHESERACDDAVLSRGVDGSEYALDLVMIARELRRPGPLTPGLAIARTSNLERRVSAMLNTHLDRRPVSRVSRIATFVGLLTIMVPIGGLIASQTAFATLSGTISDPTNAPLPDVVVTLANTQNQSKHEVRSDRTGRYEFIGLAPGQYVLEAALPGFMLYRTNLSVAGQEVERNLSLQIGGVHESITVVGDGGKPLAYFASEDAREKRSKAIAGCTSGTDAGGNILPPVKFTDVRPEYPAALRNAGIEGAVILKGRIGTDGFVKNLDVVSSPHSDLANAALSAVRKWEFGATLLNCVPVEVPIQIMINFRP